MKITLIEQLEIFFQESITYIFIYAIYALVVLGISLFLASRGDQAFEKTFLSHLVLWLSSIAVVTILLFITGWRSRLFGGEFVTFAITTIISMGILYALRRMLVVFFETVASPPWSTGLIPVVFLLLPFIAFCLYGFAMGAAWKN